MTTIHHEGDSMTTDRKFFRTVLVIEVLSEDEAFNGDLAELSEATMYGDCVGDTKLRVVEQLNGSEAVKLLEEAGSEPQFFQLNADGSDAA